MKVKINKKTFLKEEIIPAGMADDEEFIPAGTAAAVAAVGAPKNIAAMSDENESAFSAIMRQGVSTENQTVEYEMRSCSEKAGWSRMILVPVVAAFGARSLLSVNRWASQPGTSVKGPWAVVRDSFNKRFGKADPRAAEMLKTLDAQVGESMNNIRKELGPAAKAGAKKNVRRARGSNIGATIYNSTVWIGIAASGALLGVNALELGTGEWDEGAPASVKFYLEMLALSEWAMKATGAMLTLGPLDEENPFSDPCIIYPIIASAAAFAGSTAVTRRLRRGTGKESMEQVEKMILKDAAKRQRTLAEDLLLAQEKLGERLLKDSRFQGKVTPQLQKDYVDWLNNYKFYASKGNPDDKLREILKRNRPEGLDEKEYFDAFQQFSKDYNKQVASTSNKIVTSWLGKANASKKELAEVLGGQVKFSKNVVASMMKYPRLMAARLNRRKSRAKGAPDPEPLPTNARDALDNIGSPKKLNDDVSEMVSDYAKFMKDANKIDPAELLLRAQEFGDILKGILNGVPLGVRESLERTIKLINNQPNLRGEILDKILKDLKIGKEVIEDLPGEASKLTSEDIAKALTENLVRKFYGKGAHEVTDAQVKELTKFCKNMEKAAASRGITNKIAIGSLAAMSATGLVGFWMVDKELTTSGYYFKGEPGLGRWSADLLNSLFSNKVIKATSDIHYKMVTRGDRKRQIRDVLKGAVYVSKSSLETYLRDEKLLRRDEEGRISFRGFLMNLKEKKYTNAEEALEAFVEMRMTQLIKYSKKSTVQAANPEFERIDKELLTYMVEVYVYGSMFPVKMKKFIEKQQSEGFVGSHARFESAIFKLFKFGRSDITSVLQSMANIEKTVVKSHKEHLGRPGPSIQSIVPQKDINIQRERPPQQTREMRDMKISDLEKLVAEVLNENTGQGYMNYPYHSEIANNGEEAEDFNQDWKDFELALVRDQSRNIAIEVAKILVKDLELFGDVLDLVGKNQSVATEILKSMKNTEENS